MMQFSMSMDIQSLKPTSTVKITVYRNGTINETLTQKEIQNVSKLG